MGCSLCYVEYLSTTAVTDARLVEMTVFSGFNDSVTMLLADGHVLLKCFHSVLDSGCR